VKSLSKSLFLLRCNNSLQTCNILLSTVYYSFPFSAGSNTVLYSVLTWNISCTIINNVFGFWNLRRLRRHKTILFNDTDFDISLLTLLKFVIINVMFFLTIWTESTYLSSDCGFYDEHKVFESCRMFF